MVFDFEDGRTVKYDFATKTSIGIKGKPVKDLRRQLSGMTINQLIECCDDKKYAKFIAFVRKQELFPIENIGTILDRVPKYANYEQIFSAGIDEIICNPRTQGMFKFTIADIPKSLVKICKLHNIKISNKFLGFYKNNPDAHFLAYNLEYISLDDNDIYNILSNDYYETRENCSIKYYSYFNTLIDDYNYNAKALLLYIDRLKTYEALEDCSFIIREIYDYARMMKVVSPKYDKLPRNFLTTHKIACRNYNRLKKEFSEELFRKRINKDYECTFGEYIFKYPSSTQDIKDEAVSQNNCVASYIDDVIEGKCHILFLRKKDKPNESLVTIEVKNNRIVQAKRRFNDDVTNEDQKAIDAFNKKFANKD